MLYVVISMFKSLFGAGTILESSSRVLEVLGSYKVSKTTQTFILARKFDISHWFTCGADGRRTYGHVITKVSQMDRLTNFLSYGAPLSKSNW